MISNNFYSKNNSEKINQISPGKWLKKNLFNTWYNSITTVVGLWLIYWIVNNLITWAYWQAQWEVIDANFRLFFVGRYPLQALWRAWLTLGMIVGLGGISWGILADSAAKLFNRRILVILSIIAITCVAVAIPGGNQSSLILLGMLLLLIIGALLGKQLYRTLPNLSSWLPLIWLLWLGLNIWLLIPLN